MCQTQIIDPRAGAKCMKKILIFPLLIFTLISCMTYKSFVQVNVYEVTKGSTEIVFQGTIDSMKAVFRKNGILYNVKENGLETEEILIDEGTRAKYQVIEYEDNVLKMVPFWGITDKVKMQITMWAGYVAASSYSTESWDRVIYDTYTSRPAKVFHYGIQLAKQVNPDLTYK
jgi:hypothetical protein